MNFEWRDSRVTKSRQKTIWNYRTSDVNLQDYIRNTSKIAFTFRYRYIGVWYRQLSSTQRQLFLTPHSSDLYTHYIVDIRANCLALTA